MSEWKLCEECNIYWHTPSHDACPHCAALKRVQELEEQHSAIVKSALELLSASFCERHGDAVKTESFSEFYATTHGVCLRCLQERVQKLEDAIRTHSSDIIPDLAVRADRALWGHVPLPDKEEN